MHTSAKLDLASARPQRARKPARSWGDINLTLNRLVREGVIASFKTNLSSPDRSAGLEVAVVPAPTADVDSVLTRVTGDLEALVEGVTVSVDQPQAA